MGEEKARTILVVEDERPLLEAIKSKLEKNNFEVLTAHRVEQALHYLEEGEEIDVVWLDHYLLGKKDGLDFVAKCRKEGKEYKSIPIFVVSNTASAETVNTYMKLGINNYYVKTEERLDNIISHIEDDLQKVEV